MGQLNTSVDLLTANGVVPSNQGFTINIGELNIADEVHVTDTAPEDIGVLSIGKLIREHDCSFYWFGSRVLRSKVRDRNTKWKSRMTYQ